MASIAPTHRPLAAVTLLVVALIASGCAGAGPRGPVASTGATRSAAATPGASPVASPSTAAADARPAGDAEDAWLVVGRSGEDGLHVILASTGESIVDLPAGIPDATWGHLVTATTDGTTTRVEDLTVQPGLGGPGQTLSGAWRLPTIGADPTPTGLSADGRTIVLVPASDRGGATAAGAATSRFAMVDRTFAAKPRIVTLDGAFDFDAISADGTVLYVIEHLPGPPEAHYQVRAVDLPAGMLREGVVVDKSNLDEAMGGHPIGQLQRSDGMVFTLYLGAEHPFIHALSTLDAWALCIDLPAIGTDDATAALDWGLAGTLDGKSLVATNATLGVATSIASDDLSVSRTVTFAPAAVREGGITLAKFGHQAPGMTGRRTVIVPDGSIYTAGRTGVVRLARASLAVTGRFLDGTAVTGLAINPSGQTLFVLTAGGRIEKVDITTGADLGAIPANGYDRLIAIAPW